MEIKFEYLFKSFDMSFIYRQTETSRIFTSRNIYNTPYKQSIETGRVNTVSNLGDENW